MVESDGDQSRWQRICAVLDAVFDAPESERERVLAQQCAGDAELRREVEAMLAAEASTDLRVDTPAAHWAGDIIETSEAIPAHAPGDMIGAYRLLRELGRGGMGTVWLAERAGAGFQQQVALKLLKRGLDTDLVLGRFYEERRILARLRHPHIALFLDGGVADSGQPWFTMEWVDGAPITQWCDARKLGVRERIALFLDVVAAVQYAHQQLIVHRDLKPGNVLVGESGGVKLLDFGIAKMLDDADGSAQAATMTRLGVRMLTPDYAAPEQLRGDPATTATDVYALSAVLYELLCGKRPFSRSRDATGAGVQRPSSHADAAAAAVRATNLERLRRQLRGDLDTIVLKALSEEPARRYGSAQAFGEDLQRWLDGQPVQARPDSAWYRARRFVGRHRVGVVASSVVALSLLVGATVAAWQAHQANLQAQEARRQALEAQRQSKRAEQVKDFLIEIFQASNPSEWKGKQPTARDLLDAGSQRVDTELRDDPLLRAQMRKVIAQITMALGDFGRSEALLRSAMDDVRRVSGENSKDYADLLHSSADLQNLKGDYAGATRAVEREIDIRRKLPEDGDTAQALGLLSNLRYNAGRTDDAITLRKQALAISRRTQRTLDRQYAQHVLELGQLLLVARRFDEAGPLLGEASNVSRKLYGPDSVMFAGALNGQARYMNETGDLVRAANGFRAAADIFRRAQSGQDFVMAATNYGDVSCRLGKFAQAQRSFGEALAMQQRFDSRRQAEVLDRTRGKCLSDAGEFAAAEPILRNAMGLEASNADVDRNFVLGGAGLMLRVLERQGKDREAVALARRVEQAVGPVQGKDGWYAAVFLVAAAPAWFATGEPSRGVSTLTTALQDLRAANAPGRVITSAVLDLAELELQTGRPAQAEQHVRQVESLVDGGPEGPLGLRAQMLRGVALMQLGRLTDAEHMLRKVVDARRAMYGNDNPWTAEARLYLGVCLQQSGKAGQARALIEDARPQFTRASGEDRFVVRLADQALQLAHG